jgi:Protein of unknown function (DUF559)
MLYSVVTMDEAIASGIGRRKVYRLVEKGQWTRICEGVFLTEPNRSGVDRWRSELAARLLFGGLDAFVSHRSAAIMHELDGVFGWPIEVTVTRPGRRPTGAHFSKIPDSGRVVRHGLVVASLARTIRDLAAVCSADVVERALESALRGPDRRRPDIWNEELLRELRAVVLQHPNRLGNTVLATVLGRRTDTDRPTGSLPETLLFQVLRDLGLLVLRQPTLDIVDPHGRNLDRFFPDLALPGLAVIIEIDGAEAHANAPAMQRDLTRQNKIRGLRMLRFTATEVLQSPERVGRQIQRYIGSLAPVGDTWTVDGVSVTYTENHFVVVDPSRVRAA